jgi:hypothetical protein
MSSPLPEAPVRTITPVAIPVLPTEDRKPLSKKEIVADHPTWCPGCGDFSVLALYFKLIVFDWRQSPQPHRAQKHQDDLRHHG